jgi:glycosyltransferase involved in cell wall biosynthesis
VPYGANYWKLEAPKTESLAKAAAQVLDNLENFRSNACRRAEENFGLDEMVERYMKVLLE